MRKNSGTVLIVDDNPQNLQVLGNMIKDNGFEIAVAMNGHEALSYLKNDKPDLILLDIMMPEIDGFELCRQLKEAPQHRGIPIIFLTALTDLSDKLEAFKRGAVDYITKPFLKEEVLARLHVHIKLKRTMDKLRKMAVTDELTGTFNRRFCYEVLKRQISISKRKNRNFVIYYVDINNLKVINDSYGHNYGDALIKKVADGLKAKIRTTDFIFRVGGDEFLLLFPEAELASSHNLMMRVKEVLNNQKIKDVMIDFSFGYTQFLPESEVSVDELVKKADAAMYQNKLQKKNQD